MKNTKLLAGIVLATLALTWIWAYATETSLTWSTETKQEKLEKRGFHKDLWEHKMWMKKWFAMWENKLTDAEKTKLESMTDSEKKAFFEAKMTAEKAERDTKEAVIDKLINWQSLTDSEKVTLEKIKTERAERKAEMQKREAEMTKVKAILEKKKAWTALTADEQKVLDEMPKMWGRWERWFWKMWKNHNMTQTWKMAE